MPIRFFSLTKTKERIKTNRNGLHEAEACMAIFETSGLYSCLFLIMPGQGGTLERNGDGIHKCTAIEINLEANMLLNLKVLCDTLLSK